MNKILNKAHNAIIFHATFSAVYSIFVIYPWKMLILGKTTWRHSFSLFNSNIMTTINVHFFSSHQSRLGNIVVLPRQQLNGPFFRSIRVTHTVNVCLINILLLFQILWFKFTFFRNKEILLRGSYKQNEPKLMKMHWKFLS